jgi:hypothetical protein
MIGPMDAPTSGNAIQVAPPGVVAFEFDPTDDANLPGIAGADNSTVATATDMSGNSRNGTAPSANAGPNRKIDGINSENVFDFLIANLDSLLVSNGTTFSSNQQVLGMDGVFEFHDFAALYQILRVYTGAVLANRFTVQVTTTGNPRVVIRRNSGDSNTTIVSTLALTEDVASYLAVQVDYVNRTVLFMLDDSSETLALGGAAARTEAEASSAAPVIGRTPASSTAMNAYVGNIRCWTGVMTTEQLIARRAEMQVLFNTPLRTLAVDSKPATERNAILRSDGGNRDHTKTGTVLSGADADIYGRLLDVTTGTPATGWETPLLVGASSGGVWTATFDTPPGSWYAEVRKNGERDVDAVVDRSDILGVGFVAMRLGNSIEQKQYTEPASPYPQTTFPSAGDDLRDRRWSGFGYFTLAQRLKLSFIDPGTGEPLVPQTSFEVGGNGGKQFGNSMQAVQGDGIPSLAVVVTTGGTRFTDHLPGGAAYINSTTYLADTNGPGYDWDLLSMAIGTVEINDGLSAATFRTNMESFFTTWRALSTDGNDLVCYYTPPGWLEFGPTTTPNFRTIVGEAWDFLDDHDAGVLGPEGAFLGWTDHDIKRTDGAHLPKVNNGRTQRRFAQNIAFRQFAATHGARGPKLTTVTATAAGSTIVGAFTHDGPGGTELKGLVYDDADPYFLAPTFQTTGLTGTRVEINDVEVTPTSIEITDADEVTWTVPHTFTSGDTFTIALYDVHNFDQSVMLMDDTDPQGDTIGAPARPTLGVSGVVA